MREKTLAEWNKSKIKLFKLFGRKLRIKIPYSRKLRTTEVANKIFKTNTSFYNHMYQNYAYSSYHPNLRDMFQRDIALSCEINAYESFLWHVYLFFLRKEREEIISLQDLEFIICDLFKPDNIASNSFSGKQNKKPQEYIFSNCIKKNPLRIAYSTKIMRAIGKVLKYFDYPHMDAFQKWQNDISVIRSAGTYNTNLVLSIHPIDFMTASDNSCGWGSCMS